MTAIASTSPLSLASVTLRAARPEDLPAIEELLTTSGLPTTGVAESLATFMVAETGAEHGDALVGVAGLELCCENALLRSVAVAPEWRSRGLGRLLIPRVIAEAEARGIRALYLLTTTAERYFPSFGFTRTSRDAVPADISATVEFRTACPASATVMCRPCTPLTAPEDV
jgi:N-acetylglutamate synthase-like GNAT family acetyltransferase